ncbi:MAG: DUF1028 domain-containing protein [Reyranella sp.]
MTYSIIARCPRTGRLGLGITTFSIAAGGRCEGILAGVGICKTQAYVNRGNDPLALSLLAQGFAPTHVMSRLAANDPDHDYRQIAILDREGNGVGHTGSGTRPWSGHAVGTGYVAFGNVLAGPQVVEAIVAGFLADPEAPLEFRLLGRARGRPQCRRPGRRPRPSAGALGGNPRGRRSRLSRHRCAGRSA